MSVVMDPKSRMWTRWGRLKTERSSWDSHIKDIATNLLPRSSRFVVTDRNRGDKRHNAIYDSTGTRALRILAAGLMSGMTSPARPWFKLGLADQELMKHAPVQTFLADTSKLLLRIFAKSNTYRALHSGYEELGAFGTMASIMGENFETVIHHTPLTFGEYALTTNGDGVVDTIFREFQMTVGQMADMFGVESLSRSAKSLYERGQPDDWFTIVHAIEPRLDRDASKSDAMNMAWRSCYFEQEGDKDRFLRESGYKRFPVLAPRWSVVGSDIYGESPAMEALGDLKQLQHQQYRKAQAIDYMVKPAISMPTGVKGQESNLAPGGVTFMDMASPTQGARPMWEVKLDLQPLLMDIMDVRSRINGSFYADLFVMLANQPLSNATATEIAERHEEKMLMIGPVLERLHNELLEPLIDYAFMRCADAGILPPIPPELEGMQINVEFISVLAQAQRMVQTGSTDRLVAALAGVAQIKPEVLDKFDADKWADKYSGDLGTDPELIVDDETVQAVRKQRAAEQQKNLQLERSAAVADAGAKAGSIPTQGGQSNVASDVMSNFQGYASPPAEAYG